MDQTQGRSLHQGDARAQRTQQAHESSMHERVDEEVEVGSLEVFEVEVDCEALIRHFPQQVVGEEVDDEETRFQVFALIERQLVLKDERSS